MGKKVVLEGSPKYMALFTSLMTIMLAFFILLNCMSTSQEAGFNAGIGDVKDAFGIEGGLGLFQFTFAGKGSANPVSIHDPRDKNKDKGFSEDMTRRSGGSGNTDLESQDAQKSKYLRVRIPFDFSGHSSKIPENMADYLEKIGMGLALFDYKITIRCYADEFISDGARKNGVKQKIIRKLNITLASKRAVQIMRFLHALSHIPYDRMIALGYESDRLLQLSDKANDSDAKSKQGVFLYIFFKT